MAIAGKQRGNCLLEGLEMVALFVVGCGIATILSGVKSQIVFRAVAEGRPPERNPRFALWVYALDPSTPLELQAEYVKSVWAGCVALLCAALAFFSIQEFAVGCVALVVVFGSAVSAFKTWQTYKENCRRVAFQRDEDAV